MAPSGEQLVGRGRGCSFCGSFLYGIFSLFLLTPPVQLLHSKNAGQKEYVLHGVHYVVGHFMGKGFPWEKTPNLTSGKWQ